MSKKVCCCWGWDEEACGYSRGVRNVLGPRWRSLWSGWGASLIIEASVSLKSIALRSLNFLKALGKTLWLPAKKVLFWESPKGVVGDGGALSDGDEAGIWKPSCRMRAVGDAALTGFWT